MCKICDFFLFLRRGDDLCLGHTLTLEAQLVSKQGLEFVIITIFCHFILPPAIIVILCPVDLFIQIFPCLIQLVY